MTASNTKQPYFWYCSQCGDDYFTDNKQEAEKRKGKRWRCHSCVMN